MLTASTSSRRAAPGTLRREPAAARCRGSRARQPPRPQGFRPKDASEAAPPTGRPRRPRPPVAGHPGRSSGRGRMRLGPYQSADVRRWQAGRLPPQKQGSRDQHESMLLSRQPRGCKASVLCISLWMIYPNTLVSRCASVDERGCGKVDNRRNANPYPSRGPSAVHIRSELSTVQPVNFVIPATGVSFDRLLSGVADVQLRSDVLEYLTVYGCLRVLTTATVAGRAGAGAVADA